MLGKLRKDQDGSDQTMTGYVRSKTLDKLGEIRMELGMTGQVISGQINTFMDP